MTQNKPFVATVSQLNFKISRMFEEEKTFRNLHVKGEILDFKESRHLYFKLKDPETGSSVRAIMFSGNKENLNFVPENGMSVVVVCNVQCYEAGGVYQLNVTEIIPVGEGIQEIAYRQLKEKLRNEGLFSQKRQLPSFPEKICIITSENGAAFFDMKDIINRRYPLCKIILIPVFVQGVNAPDSIVNALRASGRTGADLVIFGRGGGSMDDLSAFNSEKVVRAVYESSIPTISAVGHDINVSLSDYAADVQAATPSEAAELAVPDINELMSAVNRTSDIIERTIKRRLSNCELTLKLMNQKLMMLNPSAILKEREKRILKEEYALKAKIKSLINHKERYLSEKAAVISVLNPLAILMRGYSITYKGGAAVTSEAEVKSGDKLKIRLSDGVIDVVAE